MDIPDTAAFRAAIGADTNSEATNKRGTERDQEISQKAQELLIHAQFLVDIGLFTGLRAASRRLFKLWESGQINRVGSYVFKTFKDGKKRRSRPTAVYGPSPGNQIDHQMIVSEIVAAYLPESYQVRNCPHEEDIITVIDGRTFRWEVDMGSEGQKFYQARLQKYDGTDPIVFLTITEARLKRLIRWAQESPVRSLLVFGLIDDVLADPWEEDDPRFRDADDDWVEVFHKSVV